MRRSASIFPVSILIVVMIGGCGIFGKKKAEVQMADATTDMYRPPVYEEPAGEYDPYHTDTPPAVVETSYPTPTTVAPATRYHTVAKGETLYKLARMYYGDQARWKDVYAANRTEISNPNMIRVGQRLVIP
jgi:nucleoid-associated protein YgaU